MKLDEIELEKLLTFEPEEGKVLMGTERMLIIRQDAFARLWQLLREQLGDKLANSLISQFGYKCGFGDFKALNSVFKLEDEHERLAMVPTLHTLEGIVHVTPIESNIDIKNKKFYFKGQWKNSYEGENYLATYEKPSDKPVCHSLTGYASGWCSAFAGFDTVAIERKCIGKGDDICEWEIREATAWDKEAQDWIDALHADNESIHKQLEKKNLQFEKLNKNLETEVEERTQKIKEQQAALFETTRLGALGEMAGEIAHEIKNPIAIIKGVASNLKMAINKNKLTEEFVEESSDTISRTVNRVSSIIQGLTNISRDVSSEEKEIFVLKDALKDIYGICNEKFRKKGIQLYFNPDDEIFDVKILGNRLQLSQVFLNLLNNSFDAIENQPVKNIKVTGGHQKNKVFIRFEDNGPGIPDNIKKKIFNSFYTSKELGKGTGLGLSISKNIIELHKGKLYLDESFKNTVFVIELDFLK